MKKIIIMIFMICTLLVGCSKNDITLKGTTMSKNSITEIRFKDMVEVDELRKLDGKKIKILGFLSQVSPLDGSMIYLMNMPYQNCIYCIPNTNQLLDTLAVYPKSGKSFTFTELPVEVVGTIKFEDYTDERGYFYEYRIVDAEVNVANIKNLDDNLKIYTDLIDKGFMNKINEIILLLNNINSIHYEYVEIIPEELLVELESLFDNLDKSKYSEILSIVEELKGVIRDVNNALITKDYDKLELFKGKDFEILNSVADWFRKAKL